MLRAEQNLDWLVPNSALNHDVSTNAAVSTTNNNDAVSVHSLSQSTRISSSTSTVGIYSVSNNKRKLPLTSRILHEPTHTWLHKRNVTAKIENAAKIHEPGELNRIFSPAAAMHRMAHDNVNRFFGICIGFHHKRASVALVPPVTTECVALFEYQPKDSLRNLLNNFEMSFDTELKHGFIVDCVRGLQALHEQQQQPALMHAFLHTGNILVDRKFTCKITNFSLANFGRTQVELDALSSSTEENDDTKLNDAIEVLGFEKLLFRSPEQLQQGYAGCLNLIASDIYSAGMIIVEILTRELPNFELTARPGITIPHQRVLKSFVNANNNTDVNNLVLSFCSGSNQSSISSETTTATASARLRALIGECTDFRSAARRPASMSHVQKRLLAMPEFAAILSGSLIDNLAKRLQRHTTDLEAIVNERTRALFDETRRSEQLLLQILPASVANSLKSGHAVQPELFSNVGVYFSDLVGFVELSQQSTPMQIVHTLNVLYTMFDDVVDKFHVYKVETVGDAYMVASGVPERSSVPFQHVQELCRFSIEMIKTLASAQQQQRQLLPQQSQAPALPLALTSSNKRASANSVMAATAPTVSSRSVTLAATQLELRIGLHCGPCVAGVVGIKLPRYCLFGDTVNIASRMQSTGDACKIHASSVLHECVEKYFPRQFVWQSRGDIDVKGIGIVTTFWLADLLLL